jgi:hypothetical protein
LPPSTNVTKPFIMVIYIYSMVITAVILFYNKELQQDHVMAVNYDDKKPYNIGRCGIIYSIFNIHFIQQEGSFNNAAKTIGLSFNKTVPSNKTCLDSN